MKLFKFLCGICVLVSIMIYCPPIMHRQTKEASKSEYERIEQRDPIKRASYDPDIHYEATALNPRSAEYVSERVDPRAPINPNNTTLQKLATENKEDPTSIYKNNRTFDQSFRPGGVRTHSD